VTDQAMLAASTRIPSQVHRRRHWSHTKISLVASGPTYARCPRRLRHRAGDAVVITLNYRLGVLGWSELGGLDPSYPSSGNGLRDQLTALRWVRAHVADFGGDPSNVTVAGQSEGAISISAMLATDHPENLFRRAILQGGSGYLALRGVREDPRHAAAGDERRGPDGAVNPADPRPAGQAGGAGRRDRGAVLHALRRGSLIQEPTLQAVERGRSAEALRTAILAQSPAWTLQRVVDGVRGVGGSRFEVDDQVGFLTPLGVVVVGEVKLGVDVEEEQDRGYQPGTEVTEGAAGEDRAGPAEGDAADLEVGVELAGAGQLLYFRTNFGVEPVEGGHCCPELLVVFTAGHRAPLPSPGEQAYVARGRTS
jgi:hypothetical protein